MGENHIFFLKKKNGAPFFNALIPLLTKLPFFFLSKLLPFKLLLCYFQFANYIKKDRGGDYALSSNDLFFSTERS
jgi:hypothetical protein